MFSSLVDEAHELVGMKMVRKLIRRVEAMCLDVLQILRIVCALNCYVVGKSMSNRADQIS